MADLYAIDDFINEMSDQAAAWFSIVKDRPVVVPSVQIAAQTAQVDNAALQPQVFSVMQTPLGTTISTNTILLLVGAAVVAYLVLRT